MKTNTNIGFLSFPWVDKHHTVNNVIATLAPVSRSLRYKFYQAEAQTETAAAQAWLNCHTVFCQLPQLGYVCIRGKPVWSKQNTGCTIVSY